MNYLYIDYISVAIPWSELPEVMKRCYEEYFTKQQPQDQSVEEYYNEMAGIHPEFSHLAGVALGYLTNDGEFKTRVVVNNGKDIFPEVAAMLEIFSAYDYHLISWNLDRVRSYLIKKYFKDNSPLPRILKDYQQKQWDQLDINVSSTYKNVALYPVALDVAARYLGYEESMEINMQSYLPYTSMNDQVRSQVSNRCLDSIKATKFIYEKLKSLV